MVVVYYDYCYFLVVDCMIGGLGLKGWRSSDGWRRKGKGREGEVLSVFWKGSENGEWGGGSGVGVWIGIVVVWYV